jgi:hypothetical protein
MLVIYFGILIIGHNGSNISMFSELDFTGTGKRGQAICGGMSLVM